MAKKKKKAGVGVIRRAVRVILAFVRLWVSLADHHGCQPFHPDTQPRKTLRLMNL